MSVGFFLIMVFNNRYFLTNRVPLVIVNKAHQANITYPFAISLIESVRAYERTLEKVIVVDAQRQCSKSPSLFLLSHTHTHC